MPQYSYYKALPLQETAGQLFRQHLKKRLVHMMPNVLIIIGATAVTTVAYPMVSYQLRSSQWEQRRLASPVSYEEMDKAIARSQADKPFLGSDPAMPVQAVSIAPLAPIIADDMDYTNVSNWFPKAPQLGSTKSEGIKSASSYLLSIPTLDIEDMQVVIGGEDLDKHLIHYAGTALPGEYGNPVIFGHSVLPVFYNPNSYISVFSKIPQMEIGDEILVEYDGIDYSYQVESYHEVEPDQIEVLEQRYDRKTLTLITCVPPGTYLRRGVILARLVEN